MLFKKIFITLFTFIFIFNIECAQEKKARGLIIVLNGNQISEKKNLAAKLLKKLNSKNKKKPIWIGQISLNKIEFDDLDLSHITESKLDRSITSCSLSEHDNFFDSNYEQNLNMIQVLHELANRKLNVIYDTYLSSFNINNFINNLEDGGYKVYTIGIRCKELYYSSRPLSLKSIDTLESFDNVSRKFDEENEDDNLPIDSLPSNDNLKSEMSMRPPHLDLTKLIREKSDSINDYTKYLSIDTPYFDYALIINECTKDTVIIIKDFILQKINELGMT